MIEAVTMFIAVLAALIADRAINAGMQVWAAKRLARRWIKQYSKQDTIPERQYTRGMN